MSSHPADASALVGERTGEGWISRRVTANGIISVAWQEISCGKHRAGRRIDIQLQGPMLQIWDGDELLKTVLRTNGKEVRVRADGRLRVESLERFGCLVDGSSATSSR